MVEKRKPSERLGDEVDPLRVRDDMMELKRQVLGPKVSKIVEDAIFLVVRIVFILMWISLKDKVRLLNILFVDT